MAHIIQNRWALESRFLFLFLPRGTLLGTLIATFFFFFQTDVMVGYLFHYNNEVTLALLGLSLSHLLHHSLNTNLTPPPPHAQKERSWLSSPIGLVHYHQQLLSTGPPPTLLLLSVLMRLVFIKEPAGESNSSTNRQISIFKKQKHQLIAPVGRERSIRWTYIGGGYVPGCFAHQMH